MRKLFIGFLFINLFSFSFAFSSLTPQETFDYEFRYFQKTGSNGATELKELTPVLKKASYIIYDGTIHEDEAVFRIVVKAVALRYYIDDIIINEFINFFVEDTTIKTKLSFQSFREIANDPNLIYIEVPLNIYLSKIDDEWIIENIEDLYSAMIGL